MGEDVATVRPLNLFDSSTLRGVDSIKPSYFCERGGSAATLTEIIPG
jgi:hypothetical protein